MKLLIADDSKFLHIKFKDALKEDNFEIHSVYDGKSALDELITDKYDLCLLDINMPEMTGLSVLKVVQNQRLKTKIIIISANLTKENILTVHQCGAFHYLHKHNDFKKLREEILGLI